MCSICESYTSNLEANYKSISNKQMKLINHMLSGGSGIRSNSFQSTKSNPALQQTSNQQKMLKKKVKSSIA